MQSKSKKVDQGFWERHSDAWKESGLGQRAYCEREGISYRSFIYRRNQLVRHSRKEVIHFVARGAASNACNYAAIDSPH